MPRMLEGVGCCPNTATQVGWWLHGFIVAVFMVSGHWLWFGGCTGGDLGWLAEARIWTSLLL